MITFEALINGLLRGRKLIEQEEQKREKKKAGQKESQRKS